MKKFSFRLNAKALTEAVLAVALVFGLALAGCAGSPSSSPDDPPVVTELFTRTEEAFIAGNRSPTNSFSVGDGIMFTFSGTAGSNNLVKFDVSVKLDNTEVWSRDWTDNPLAQRRGRYQSNTGAFSTETPGSYIVELFFEDAKGIKSNTMTYSFTVQ